MLLLKTVGAEVAGALGTYVVVTGTYVADLMSLEEGRWGRGGESPGGGRERGRGGGVQGMRPREINA